MEYSTLVACIIGTAAMLAFTPNWLILIPNFVMIIFCLVGIYFTRVKRMYDFAVHLIIIGCAYITLPFMYFTAGGNISGMPLWFVFGVVFSCMMSKGKSRIVLPSIGIALLSVCLVIGYKFPGIVIPLSSPGEEFIDLLQSFIIVSIMLCGCIMVYLHTYDKQRDLLEYQRNELKRITNTDALTGISNRRAYYEDTDKYRNSSAVEDVVVVTMDLNGLKKINDNLGHDAGDAFIKGASRVISEALSEYGTIYRTGGDEFMAVLSMSDSKSVNISQMLEESIKASTEELMSELTIASGVVCWNQNKDLSFSDIEKIADKNMYRNKSEYYRKSGLDRRQR